MQPFHDDLKIPSNAAMMDTIAAIATPFGAGGIGIVRISGPDAINISRRLFRKKASSSNEIASTHFVELVSHRVHHGYIVDPASGLLMDEVLLVPMAAPNSYTRENVVEIQTHAGIVLLRKMLTLVLDNGARIADPGEFTRRAFLNGRIDLSQAESVADLINARSEQELSLAASQLNGDMRDQICQLIDHLTYLCADLQAAVEFPEEHDPTGPGLDPQVLRSQLAQPIEDLLNNYRNARLYREGLNLCIVGKPNVGKSSILNRLLDYDKAIVTPFPGTTRDPVEGSFLIHGVPINITDTAGLHFSLDPIEQIGMQKTKDSIMQADYILFILEAGQPYGSEDEAVYRLIQHKKIIVVANKIDLSPYLPGELPADLPQAVVAVSALDGSGFGDLKERLVDLCGLSESGVAEKGIVPNIRQKKNLDSARIYLNHAFEAIEEGLPHDLILIDLESANNHLKAIVGQSASVDLLDEIFSRFCIGK